MVKVIVEFEGEVQELELACCVIVGLDTLPKTPRVAMEGPGEPSTQVIVGTFNPIANLIMAGALDASARKLAQEAKTILLGLDVEGVEVR